MLATCLLWGQVPSKKNLTPQDYHRWSTLLMPQISDDGQWVSYTKQYDYGQDTLFIRSTDGKDQYAHPGGGRPDFSPDGSKVLVKKGNTLLVQELDDGKIEKIGPVLGYEMGQKGTWALIKRTGEENKGQSLEIRFWGTGRVYRLAAVETHLISPKGEKLLFVRKKRDRYTLHLLDLGSGKSKPTLLRTSKFPFQQLVWAPSGNSFAFLQKESGSKDRLILYFHRMGPMGQWSRLGPGNSDTLMVADQRLLISPDGSKVLFKGRSMVEKSKEGEPNVEIWHSMDKLIYPRRKALGMESIRPYDHIWRPGADRVQRIGSPMHPNVVPIPDFSQVLSFNLWDNEPQYKRNADLDFYITDLETGKKQLVVDELTYQVKYLTMSIDGRYLKYFKKGNWWLYDVKAERHINLTQGLDRDWSYVERDNSDNVVAYGSPGWGKTGKEVLVYDRYDIWKVTVDGRHRERLTRGREKGIRYRIHVSSIMEPYAHSFPAFMGGRFDLGKGLVLQGSGDDLNSGYFLWGADKGTQTLVYGPKRFYGLKTADSTGVYIYLEETFEEPTRLVHLKMGQDPRTLAVPNAFQKEYAWGRSSLIDYQNKKGDTLKGVLVHPANYDPGQKYPMVVRIYEEQLGRLYKSVVPTESITTDYMNPSVLASKGYLVLYPNIRYELGKTGESALDCVVSAVNKVIDMGLADPERVGLYGASFGGFETTYIISQTNLFATAIAGAAITDIVSRYLSINEKSGQGEAWRYEHHQFRMGDSFKEDFEGFAGNSPVYNVHGMNTPLLAWVGKEDPNVSWHQSVELFLALRRLQKEHVLLVYPGEQHTILSEENKRDLVRRMSEWMDHYLKGSPKKAWMLNKDI
ncbi:prolyl oligopeptidase family serine peptidase [Flagellimonas amoyensis]|uniref:S9 family peptidase n=1 Tax=Flagellimonas amoyensis TaxID=2169401 RepID=UPI00131EE0D5|nr:prolyl oligopeptidase family serine peptidase [Allomuricauda amoyensis]